MYIKKILFNTFLLILAMIACIVSCTMSYKLENPKRYSIIEETGMVLHKEDNVYNYFIPVIDLDTNRSLLEVLLPENIKPGFTFGPNFIGNQFLDFWTRNKLPKETYTTIENVEIELIPVKVIYKKYKNRFNRKCEKDIYIDTLNIDNIIYVYSTTSCAHFGQSISTLR